MLSQRVIAERERRQQALCWAEVKRLRALATKREQWRAAYVPSAFTVRGEGLPRDASGQWLPKRSA